MQEREWVDCYHATVLSTLGPILREIDDEAYGYLVQQTRPLCP